MTRPDASGAVSSRGSVLHADVPPLGRSGAATQPAGQASGTVVGALHKSPLRTARVQPVVVERIHPGKEPQAVSTAWHLELRRERTRFMETMSELTDDEFNNAKTLCADWAPRDVLAHVVGLDRMASHYFRPSTLTVNRGNARMVAHGRTLSRAELTDLGWKAAEEPSGQAQAMAWLLTGDMAMHHQDVLRGLGRHREIPETVARALFREGVIWSWPFGRKLTRYRVVPTTPGGRPRGRGRLVSGTTEALSMWLAGRESVANELTFQ
ncbi:maleylpyruvate isomerase family mycothiol-dependent enzyme [Streptomyces sp. NPDC002076]